jgi:Xaa-Pro aminopeptidase
VDPGFRGIGVRIEDDVVLTTEGHENLTAAIPKATDDVEALVAGG